MRLVQKQIDSIRLVAPDYAFSRRIEVAEATILFQFLAQETQLDAIEEALDLLEAQEWFRPYYRKLRFRLFNFGILCLAMVPLCLMAFASSSWQFVVYIFILIGIMVTDFGVTWMLGLRKETRERRALWKAAGACISQISSGAGLDAGPLIPRRAKTYRRLVYLDLIEPVLHVLMTPKAPR